MGYVPLSLCRHPHSLRGSLSMPPLSLLTFHTHTQLGWWRETWEIWSQCWLKSRSIRIKRGLESWWNFQPISSVSPPLPSETSPIPTSLTTPYPALDRSLCASAPSSPSPPVKGKKNDAYTELPQSSLCHKWPSWSQRK